jgi:hypothetical protein
VVEDMLIVAAGILESIRLDWEQLEFPRFTDSGSQCDHRAVSTGQVGDRPLRLMFPMQRDRGIMR